MSGIVNIFGGLVTTACAIALIYISLVYSFAQTVDFMFATTSTPTAAWALSVIVQFGQIPVKFAHSRAQSPRLKFQLMIVFWVLYFLDAVTNVGGWINNPQESTWRRNDAMGWFASIFGVSVNLASPLADEAVPYVIALAYGYFYEAATGKNYKVSGSDTLFPMPELSNKDNHKRNDNRPNFGGSSSSMPPKRPTQDIKPQSFRPSQNTKPQPQANHKPMGSAKVSASANKMPPTNFSKNPFDHNEMNRSMGRMSPSDYANLMQDDDEDDE